MPRENLAAIPEWENPDMFKRLGIVAVIFLLALCSAIPAQQKPAAPGLTVPANPVAAAAAASTNAESDLVVLRVSGEPITEKQVMAAMEVLAKQIVLKPDQQNQRNAILFKGAIDNLVITTLLRAEARKQNISVPKEMIDQQFDSFAKRFPSMEEFKKALAEHDSNEEKLRKSIEETLSAQEVLEKVADKIPDPSDEEVQRAYDNNPYSVPERMHLAQIFIKADPGSTPEQKAELRKKLESIRADIEAKKITFAEAADKNSQAAAGAPKGGDIGLIAKAQITVKELAEAVFSTAPGSMTPVIEGPQGFHLVNVMDIKPAGKRPLEEIKPMIQQQLKLAAQQSATRKYAEELKAKAMIEPFMTADEFEKRHPAD